MGEYKRIERLIGEYISRNYRTVVEVGVGENLEAARIVRDAGVSIRCTDVRPSLPACGIRVEEDDIFSPREDIYAGAELIYAIRPGIEMVPPLMELARRISAELLVYHLGDEIYGDGGDVVDCGVILHRYHRRVKRKK